MPYTLATDALVTLAQAKQEIGQLDNDPTTNDALTGLVNASTAAVMEYAQREFKTITTGSTVRTFSILPGTTGGYVDFGRFDAQSVTVVQVDTQLAAPTTLAATDYQLVPPEKWRGVYTGLIVTGSSFPLAASGMNMIHTAAVTGTWGWPSVPADVQRACLVTIAMWYRHEQAALSSSFQSEQDTTFTPRVVSLPFGARALLAPYRRPSVA